MLCDDGVSTCPGHGRRVSAIRRELKPRRRSSRETEALLLESATQVFSKKGFLDATVDDIINGAGVSRGAFYIYFHNKNDIFERLINMVVQDLMELPSVSRSDGETTTRARLLAANRNYLQAFGRHRELLRGLYQVAAFNPEIAAKHRELRQHFMRRIQRSIEKGTANGRCHPLNPEVASQALGLMMDSFAYHWLSSHDVPSRPPFDFETVLATLTDLWYNAVYREDPRSDSGGIV